MHPDLAASLFEGFMLICFGASWPVAVWKTIRTKNVDSLSAVFLWLLFAGYVAGALSKLAAAWTGGPVSPVIVLYLSNLLLVGVETVLYYRYRQRPVAK